MTLNQVLYLISPLGLALICYKLLNIPECSYWFYVWIFCLASIFTFVKFILPYHEQKFNAISEIDFEGAFEDKNKELKPYTYIAGLHMVVFFGLIILYFIN